MRLRRTMNGARGFALVDVMMSVLIVGIISVVLTGYYSVLFRVPVEIAVKNKANNLAGAAMEELKCRAWEEPSGPRPLGVDSGETAANKTTFDDIDDFNGYSESPPRYQDGAVMPGLSGYSVSFAVTYVDAALNATASATDRKMISVTVKNKNIPKITLYTVLSRNGAI